MNSISNFELLDFPVIGCILDHLNQGTGSKGFLNQADIPVVMRYVNCLACTSKKMVVIINHSEATQIFLYSLAHKYNESWAHFAAVFNTVNARQLLWDHIKKNGDIQTYEIIQDIQKLASDILKEVENLGSCLREGSPHPSLNQTKQGFIWCNGGGSTSSYLGTPFGNLPIYNITSFTGSAPYSISEVFIKRLNLVFEGITAEGNAEDNFFEIAACGDGKIRYISPENMKKIKKEELKNKKGTQNLIVNSNLYENHCFYKIKTVNGQQVPDLIHYDGKESKRSYDLVARIWEMVKANRLGKDPLFKKLKNEACNSSTTLETFFTFHTILQVPQWSITQVEALNQQRIENSGFTQTKTLALKSMPEALLIEILNQAAKPFLDKNSAWSIHSSNEKICLWIDNEQTLCELSTLKTAYESIMINSIGQNWVKAELKDYSSLLYKKSEEDYVLFVKKKEKIISREDGFIKCLVNGLGFSKAISCSRCWLDGTESDLNRTESDIYLWIKKDQLQQILKILNIKSD